MNLMPLKQRYWDLCNRIHRWRHPIETVLSPEDPTLVLKRLLADHDKKPVMVDGGAHDGVVAREFAEAIPGLQIHAFEPNTDLLPDLKANLARIPGSIVTSALSATSGSTEMNINASPMTGSILPTGDFAHKYFADVMEYKETRTIPMTSLDDWSAANDIPRVDLLKLDLQGYEIEAIKGATQLLKRGVRAIYTEINFVPFYEGAAIFSDLDVLMRENGYRLYNYYNLATRHEDMQLGGADAIYIPHEDHPAFKQSNTNSNAPLRKAA